MPKKKKRKKIVTIGNVIAQKKKKKKAQKKRATLLAMLLPRGKKNHLKKIWAFLSIKKKFTPTQFSLYFGEKIFWWAQGENTWAPPFIFLPSYPTKHTPKRFSFLFSLQNFPSTLFYLQTNTPLS